ncbi:MAG: squalene/phytoene synthase family protein [Verrucomicrobiae bacterium]|nr:squalene/phytoene synthase family protein [Verrucomicrobiae bacterium]
MTAPESAPLTCLLREVSRSFHLTLRLLPTPVRTQIGVAYLLARATDTIADTAILPMDLRIEALHLLKDRILGVRAGPVDFGSLAENQARPAERLLLQRIEEVIAELNRFACFDRCCVREVLETIASGQELDLRRFGEADPGQVVALATEGDLDDYTFRVAGCVGGFWTRLCRSHLYPREPLCMARYLDDAGRFGKGLQLVNILRDLPVDLRQGRCYIPRASLDQQGLQPEDLLDPGTEPRFRPLYSALLLQAADHLTAGWRYTCTTPRNQFRVRLGCALPLLIGAETLRLLAVNRVLNPARRWKVSRWRVRSLLFQAIVWHPFPHRWERLFSPELPDATFV